MEPDNFHSPFWRHRFRYFIIIAIILTAFILPRFVHLDADPQPLYISNDSGYIIDEGYKTFAPKNLLVFGNTNWHPDDNYSGWMKTSPFTQWPYYYTFKNIGLELKNARMVSVIYAGLFLSFSFYLLLRRYGLALSTLGVILLASDVCLFFFSRSALFEMAIILFLYAGILLTTRVPDEKPLYAVAIMVAFAFPAVFAIKLTAIVYYTPPIAAVSLLAIVGAGHSRGKNVLYISVLALLILSVVFVTRDTWHAYLNTSAILNAPRELLLNPMPELSPLALLLGYSSILSLLLVKPETLYNNIYRLSLVAIVIGGPIILSLVQKHPPRYFVAIIPACLLLAIEWYQLKPWKLSIRSSFSTTQKLAIAAVFIVFSMLLLRALETLVIRNLPITIGEDPGIDISTLYKLLPFFVIGLYILYHLSRSGTVNALGIAIRFMAVTSIAMGIYTQAMAISHPSYESQTIRTALNECIGDNESIAGDWAAFFTAEAPIRSFYMSKGINFPDPEHIDKIRPDYFLFSDTAFDKKSLAALENNDQVKLGKPRKLGQYSEHTISIYRIHYIEKTP